MNRIWRVALNKVIPKPCPFYPVFSPNDVFIGLYRRRAWKRALPSSGSIVFTSPRYSFYMFKNGKLLCVCEIFYLFSTVCFHISKHKLCQACKKNRFAPPPLPPKKRDAEVNFIFWMYISLFVWSGKTIFVPWYILNISHPIG